MPDDAPTLSISTVTATIHAPAERVDIADWLDNLVDAEYQRCSTAHIAAGVTKSDDGRPMSINVEMIGEALVVQHYVHERREPLHCRLVSLSDTITKNGRTRVKVVWELKARRIDESTCEYTNHIHSYATPEFLDFLEAHGTTLEQAAAARQQASDSHNREETPNFARSLERAAQARASALAVGDS